MRSSSTGMGLVAFFAICVILPACLAHTKEPERHSLYYVYIALSKNVSSPGIFEFTAMGLLDDRKIDSYNSRDKVKVPEQDWMREKLPADYWEKGTQSRRSKEQWFKVNVNILMERMRHNGSDIHSLMWRHGCEANKMADGSFQFVKGVDEYSYDGMDFLSFDDCSMQWVAPIDQALQTKRKWDGVPILNQYTKGYLEKECVEWLGKFQTYGDKELQENQTSDRPEVYLFAKNCRPSGEYSLTCFATAFYPKDIEISILKNDWPVKDGHPSDVRPNGDGTHQIMVTVGAKKVEIHMYKCRVMHRTLKEPIVVEWTSDPPEVHFFVKNGRPSGEYTLTCFATGFYPKDIKISILKNDLRVKDGHPNDVLPNGDGTHQLRVSVEAKKVEIHMYKCEVIHRTLEEPIVVEWTSAGVLPPGESSPIGTIVGVALALLLDVGFGFGLYLAKKRAMLESDASDIEIHDEMIRLEIKNAVMNSSRF